MTVRIGSQIFLVTRVDYDDRLRVVHLSSLGSLVSNWYVIVPIEVPFEILPDRLLEYES